MITKLSIIPKSLATGTEEAGAFSSVSGCVGLVNFKVLYSPLAEGKSLTIRVMNASDDLGNGAKEVASYKVTKTSTVNLSGVCELDLKPSARATEFYAVYCKHDNSAAITVAGEISYNSRYSE